MSAPGAAAALTATEPIIAARLTRVAEKNHRPGVLGLRAAPRWHGGGFTHRGVPVAVAACPSTLAVWEALEARADGEWLVVLTPVDEKELGDGILAHLVDGRLLSPDPWAALRAAFAATAIEPALYRVADDRDLAMGLLALLPQTAITPAPGGVLTRAHALTAVAHAALRIAPDATEIDGLAILEWSVDSSAGDAVRGLRENGGDALTESMVVWLGERAGRLGPVVEQLLRRGRPDLLVPLGLVAGVLIDPATGVEKARWVLEHDYGLTLDAPTLKAWYGAASALLATLADTAVRRTVLDAAEAAATAIGAGEFVAASQELPSGLTARVRAVAEAIAAALPARTADEADTPQVGADAMTAVEERWSEAGRHALAAESRDRAIFAAAVRLLRWLGVHAWAGHSMPRALHRQVHEDAWVDAALTVVRRGVDDPPCADALARLLETAEVRRRAHDREFAVALGHESQPSVPGVEELLRDVVVPLAKERPTLLLVVDALSMSAATAIVRDAVDDGWSEGGPQGRRQRMGALAALPSLTGRSRTSLLCGELREGTADTERSGFLAVLKATGLQAKPGVPDPIFHKKALDAVPAGRALATDVANALADTAGRPLVAAVLNYVDDTLHHTDPGGTDWTIDTITHLRALLKAAREAGRAVVISSDHGHVIERGSTRLERGSLYGQRAHGELGRVSEQEVMVSGQRVLTATGEAVLAVDEDIRYGAVNAGYHGGGSPAEVVVPVIALYTGDRPRVLGELGEVEPVWWCGPIPVESPEEPAVPVAARVPEAAPSLFDEPVAEPSVPVAGPSLAEQVVATAVFRQQWKSNTRRRITEEQVQALLTALLAAPARELPNERVAAVLGVAVRHVTGAVTQVKSVLDIDGYQVLTLGAGVVGIDEALLREQFGVG
ncbi:BREX-2 system phosphatase PglZ [Tomitella fengzijianii]|uniref:BREX-2 system phosphatase PglZ n=1 Tax=Tomitella fengzijianii TaxID=2597660 RepID=UPI00131AA8B9|nr:BREX-2 system phosphatase PglZ [Tomitella fengzijianii]